MYTSTRMRQLAGPPRNRARSDLALRVGCAVPRTRHRTALYCAPPLATATSTPRRRLSLDITTRFATESAVASQVPPGSVTPRRALVATSSAHSYTTVPHRRRLDDADEA